MGDQIEADSDTLDWYKERILYLEEIRTDLARQLEHGNYYAYLDNILDLFSFYLFSYGFRAS